MRNNVLPVLQGCAGFKGQLLLIDRAKGESIGISLWDTEENMNASEEKVAAVRQQAADQVGGGDTVEIALYELPVFEIA